MKIKSPNQNPAALITAAAIICFIFLAMPVMATGVINKKPVKKTNTKIKSLVSRNNNAIKIYPDIFKRKMHVVAKDNASKEIDFFVFDLQGTLVHNYKMKPRDRKQMINMERGSYVYRVFCGDEEAASGTFQVH